MKIGVIGAGAIGRTYATLWSAAGHDIVLSSRNPQDLGPVAQALGDRVRIGTPAEAARSGDVVLLAVNYGTLDQAIEAMRPHVRDKLVIDATNPLRRVDGGGVERVLPDDAVAGPVTAAKLPEARIAKALTTLWTGHVEQHANVETPTVAMPLAADDPADRSTVAGLIRDAGLVPVDLGTLALSRPLDPPSSIWNVVLTAEELQDRVAAWRRASGPDAPD